MRLSQLASFIKSANAGATALTFDIGFDDPEAFERTLAAGVISPESVAALYGLSPSQVQVFAYRPAWVIKVTVPRPVITGGIAERDFDGVQQFAPLLDLQAPDTGEQR